MKWPYFDPDKTIAEIEGQFSILEEIDDDFHFDLGAHPSKSFYRNPEPDFDAMRAKFDATAKKYRSR